LMGDDGGACGDGKITLIACQDLENRRLNLILYNQGYCIEMIQIEIIITHAFKGVILALDQLSFPFLVCDCISIPLSVIGGFDVSNPSSIKVYLHPPLPPCHFLTL